MTHELIDIGSNLTHSSFAADLDEVIRAAVAAGVTRQLVTGTDLASSRAAADLAARQARMLWSTAGVHPHHAGGVRRRRFATTSRRSWRGPGWWPWANVGSIIFAIFRRAPHSEPPSSPSSRSPRARASRYFCISATRTRISRPSSPSTGRRCAAGWPIASPAARGARSLPRSRSVDRHHGLGLRRAPRRRLAHSRAAHTAGEAAARDGRTVSACRAISSRHQSRVVTSLPICRTSRPRWPRCAANRSRTLAAAPTQNAVRLLRARAG